MISGKSRILAAIATACVLGGAFLALTTALPWTATLAQARGPFDGTWSVLIVTDSGSCDRAYRYALQHRQWQGVLRRSVVQRLRTCRYARPCQRQRQRRRRNPPTAPASSPAITAMATGADARRPRRAPGIGKPNAAAKSARTPAISSCCAELAETDQRKMPERRHRPPFDQRARRRGRAAHCASRCPAESGLPAEPARERRKGASRKPRAGRCSAPR